jgi:sodium/potassium-transporting ATPase subunit alpha
MLAALALGTERPSGAVMRAPPRPRGEALLTSAILLRAYAFLGPIEAAAAMTVYFFILWQGGWSWGQSPSLLLYQQATTACLTAVIVTQIANGFVCRSARESVWPLGWLTNRLLLIGIVAEISLQLAIVCSPIGQRMFGTAALPISAWLVAVSIALFLFAADEARRTLASR